VSNDGRHLEEASGRPFYFVADTQWPLLFRYNSEETCEIIDDRAVRGSTAITVIVADKNQPDRAAS